MEIHESFSVPGKAVAVPYGDDSVVPGGAPLRLAVWFAEDSEGASCSAAVLENVFGTWEPVGWVADMCPLEAMFERVSGKPGTVEFQAVPES